MNVNLTMTAKQQEVYDSESEITIFSAGRGCGKTAFLSMICTLNLLQNRRVLIIGPTLRQLEDSNFRQTRLFLDKRKITYDCNKTKLRIKKGSRGEIMHVSAEEPEYIRSYTSIDVLIYDEMASLPEEVWIVGVGTTRDTATGKSKIYIVGTPPHSEYHWVSRLNKREDVKTILGSYRENPFNGKDYVERLCREYRHLPYDMMRREMYGEFIFSTGSGSLFDNFRIETRNAYSISRDYPVVCGLDIAGTGRDLTCAVVSQGDQVLGIYLRKTADENHLKQFAREVHTIHGFNVLRYDSTGLGHLLVLELPSSVQISPVNFSESGGERFNKIRTAMYYHLRMKNTIYMHESILKEHGDTLMSELKATAISEKENKKLSVIEKKDIKKLIGRSPDIADALVLSESHIEFKRTKPRIAPLVFGRR
jgi:hypothetical protein